MLKNNILHVGYCESFSEYKKWLCAADILPVTSNQDFFGVSIIEAIYCNVIPLLPNRLSYPEILSKDCFPELFYKDNNFYNRLNRLIRDYKNLRNSISDYKKLIIRFDWQIIKNEYDRTFEEICN